MSNTTIPSQSIKTGDIVAKEDQSSFPDERTEHEQFMWRHLETSFSTEAEKFSKLFWNQFFHQIPREAIGVEVSLRLRTPRLLILTPTTAPTPNCLRHIKLIANSWVIVRGRSLIPFLKRILEFLVKICSFELKFNINLGIGVKRRG